MENGVLISLVTYFMATLDATKCIYFLGMLGNFLKNKMRYCLKLLWSLILILSFMIT